MISCVIKTGAALTANGAELLYRIAHKMARQEKKRGKASFGDDCYAIVETDWGTTCIVSPLAGIRFYGEVVTKSGITNIEFIVAENDLEGEVEEEGFSWYRLTPVEKRRPSHEWN